MPRRTPPATPAWYAVIELSSPATRPAPSQTLHRFTTCSAGPPGAWNSASWSRQSTVNERQTPRSWRDRGLRFLTLIARCRAATSFASVPKSHTFRRLLAWPRSSSTWVRNTALRCFFQSSTPTRYFDSKGQQGSLPQRSRRQVPTRDQPHPRWSKKHREPFRVSYAIAGVVLDSSREWAPTSSTSGSARRVGCCSGSSERLRPLALASSTHAEFADQINQHTQRSQNSSAEHRSSATPNSPTTTVWYDDNSSPGIFLGMLCEEASTILGYRFRPSSTDRFQHRRRRIAGGLPACSRPPASPDDITSVLYTTGRNGLTASSPEWSHQISGGFLCRLFADYGDSRLPSTRWADTQHLQFAWPDMPGRSSTSPRTNHFSTPSKFFKQFGIRTYPHMISLGRYPMRPLTWLSSAVRPSQPEQPQARTTHP